MERGSHPTGGGGPVRSDSVSDGLGPVRSVGASPRQSPHAPPPPVLRSRVVARSSGTRAAGHAARCHPLRRRIAVPLVAPRSVSRLVGRPHGADCCAHLWWGGVPRQVGATLDAEDASSTRGGRTRGRRPPRSWRRVAGASIRGATGNGDGTRPAPRRGERTSGNSDRRTVASPGGGITMDGRGGERWSPGAGSPGRRRANSAGYSPTSIRPGTRPRPTQPSMARAKSVTA